MARSAEKTIEVVEAQRTYKAVLLYSVMSDWTNDDTVLSDESISRMKRGLSAAGVEATPVSVRRDVAGPVDRKSVV